MVAYADTTDFNVFGLPTATLNALASGAVQSAQLASASGRMDSYFRARYNMPFTAWGDELRECCCVLAACTIIRRRGFNPDNKTEADLVTRETVWLTWLDRVAAGTLQPNVTEASAESWFDGMGELSDTPRYD